MKNPRVQWVLALVLTLASAYWQRVSGPTYPLKGTVALDGQEIGLRLTRSHGGTTDQPVRIEVPDEAVTGEVAWRRFPTSEPWQTLSLVRRGTALEAALPNQPAAGKLEYQVRLRRGQASAVFPARSAVTRFKGEVSPIVLAPHILAMFAAMLFSSKALLASLAGTPARAAVNWTFWLIVVGGFVLGPAVQKQAFDEWWAGVPYGWDLTDNKTLIAGLGWLWAWWRTRGGRTDRLAVVAAAVITLGVFAIPHSTWGSQIDWSTRG
jgi:hypothetical protein